MPKIHHRGGALVPAERARLSVVYRATGDLRAYDRNSRTHSEAQVRQIRASIDKFGFNSPILLKDDETTIGAGHGRWMAAQLEPPIDQVPTITLTGLTEAEWRAYVIADNRLGEQGGWDQGILADELAAVLAELPDIGEALGYEPDALAEFMAPDFEPITSDATPRLDRRTETTCPKCGHGF